MQSEINFTKIGQRIKTARIEKGFSQADLGSLIGCSNNHVSHVEVGQTKISLSMLLKLSLILEKDFDYFLLDTPYAKNSRIINTEIADKLNKCNSHTLITINKIIDILLEQQESLLYRIFRKYVTLEKYLIFSSDFNSDTPHLRLPTICREVNFPHIAQTTISLIILAPMLNIIQRILHLLHFRPLLYRNRRYPKLIEPLHTLFKIFFITLLCLL